MLCDYLSYVPLYRESFYYQYPNSDVLEFVKTSTEDFSHSIEEVVKLIWSVDVLSFFKKIVNHASVSGQADRGRRVGEAQSSK